MSTCLISCSHCSLPSPVVAPLQSFVTLFHFLQATAVGLLKVLHVCVTGLEAPLWGGREQDHFAVIICAVRTLISVSFSGSSSLKGSFAVHFHPSCLLFFSHLLGLNLNVASSKRSLIILFPVGSLIYSLALSFN